eukprot:832351-Prymnesium_polylepis.1
MEVAWRSHGGHMEVTWRSHGVACGHRCHIDTFAQLPSTSELRRIPGPSEAGGCGVCGGPT